MSSSQIVTCTFPYIMINMTMLLCKTLHIPPVTPIHSCQLVKPWLVWMNEGDYTLLLYCSKGIWVLHCQVGQKLSYPINAFIFPKKTLRPHLPWKVLLNKSDYRVDTVVPDSWRFVENLWHEGGYVTFFISCLTTDMTTLIHSMNNNNNNDSF